MIQFDEACFANGSLHNVALVDGGIVVKKQHSMTDLAATFLQNGTTQSLDE